MELKRLSHNLTMCKVNSIKDICFDTEFFFIGKTDEEISFVCKTEDTPTGTIEREDGWNGFWMCGNTSNAWYSSCKSPVICGFRLP